MGLFFKKKQAESDLPPLPEIEEMSAPEFPEIPKGIRDEKREELEHEAPTSPIFMNIEDYKGILEELELAKNILKEADDAAARIDEFSLNEEQHLKKWYSLVSDIQKNLIYCEKTLFR